MWLAGGDSSHLIPFSQVAPRDLTYPLYLTDTLTTALTADKPGTQPFCIMLSLTGPQEKKAEPAAASGSAFCRTNK